MVRCWETMVLVSFIFAVILIRVNDGAVCPSTLYFYLVPTTDDREAFSRSRVDNFDQCIRRCYASDFCFSVIFWPSTTPGPVNGNGTASRLTAAECRLSYTSAFNCTHKTLTNKYSSPDRPAIAECIKCPSLGEYVSRQSLKAAGDIKQKDHTTMSETKAHFTTAQQTTVTELYPTSSTEKRTPNFSTVKQTKSIDRASSSSISSLIQGEVISDKTGVGATGRSIDRKSWRNIEDTPSVIFEAEELTERDLKSLALAFDHSLTTTVRNATECAELCLKIQCRYAVFDQEFLTSSHSWSMCRLGKLNPVQCQNSKKYHEFQPKPNRKLLIRCVQLLCRGSLTYRSAPVDGRSQPALNFVDHEDVSSSAQCAARCYSKRCAVASFHGTWKTQDVGDSSTAAATAFGACFFAYDETSAKLASDFDNVADQGVEISRSNDGPRPVRIWDVKCRTGDQREQLTQVVAGDEDSPLAETTTIGNNLAFEKNPNDQG
uniref:PAN domain protein n=1 Tax=Romanomermis culicivorax TaxID=13658 RepID=A0A915HZP3_ROMCU